MNIMSHSVTTDMMCHYICRQNRCHILSRLRIYFIIEVVTPKYNINYLTDPAKPGAALQTLLLLFHKITQSLINDNLKKIIRKVLIKTCHLFLSQKNL